MEFFRRTYADINLENLVENWQHIQKIAADDRFICPMVKANAYGHGAAEVAHCLEQAGAKTFGVCLIEEALNLRSAGIKSDILVFGGFDKVGAEKIDEYQLTPVVSAWEQLKALESVAEAPLKVHVKFDTGMNRLGFKTDDADKISDYFKKSKLLKLKAVLTHLACSEDSLSDSGMTSEQLNKLQNVREHFSAFDIHAHALNSGAILNLEKCKELKVNTKLPLLNSWGFRPGLMLYGYAPGGDYKSTQLKPVLTFKSYISQVKTLNEGESVSYGATWKAKRQTVIGIVPAGYADGVDRRLTNRGSMFVGEHKVPMIGTVCMDYTMLDITDLAEKNSNKNWLDEEVIFFGQDEHIDYISADDVAKLTDTVSWEVLTSVSYRVPRHFKGLKKS